MKHDFFELSNGLYCFCTDTYDSMLLCSLFWGSEPFCNFRFCLPKSFPCTLPLPPRFSGDLCPIAVLVAPRRVTMMSPLCLSLVPIVFLNFVYRPSCLAVLLCEVLALLNACYKGNAAEGLDKRKAWWEEGYTGSRAEGPMAVNGFGPFCHSFCCKS